MSFIASGDVSDFSPSVVESIKIVIAGIANHAPGVQLTSSNIEVTVSSASVNVLVMIHAPSAQAAASITAVMAGVFLSPATLEAALTAGGTEGVSITQIISAPTLQPPQMNSIVLPSTASDQGSSLTWAVVAGLAGLGILLLGLVFIICTLWVHLKRQSATSAESAAKQATSNEVAIEMMRNLATQSKPRSFLHSCSRQSSSNSLRDAGVNLPSRQSSSNSKRPSKELKVGSGSKRPSGDSSSGAPSRGRQTPLMPSRQSSGKSLYGRLDDEVELETLAMGNADAPAEAEAEPGIWTLARLSGLGAAIRNTSRRASRDTSQSESRRNSLHGPPGPTPLDETPDEDELAHLRLRRLSTIDSFRSEEDQPDLEEQAKPSTSATFDGPTPRLNRQPSLDEILEVEQDTSVCPASLPPSLPAEQSKMKPVLASSTSPPRGMIKLGAKAASCDAEIGLASQSPSVKLSPLDIAQVNRYRFSGIIVAPTEEGQTSERNERAESARESELKDTPGRLTSRYSARLSARREAQTSTHLPVPAGLPDPRCRPRLPSVDASSSTRPSQLDLNQDGVISEGEMASRFLPRTVREGHMAVAAEAPSKPVAPQDEAEDGPATVQQI